MADKRANVHIQVAQICHARPFIRDVADNLIEPPFISFMKLLMSWEIRVLRLHLEIFLMGEMFIHIINKEFNRQ